MSRLARSALVHVDAHGTFCASRFMLGPLDGSADGMMMVLVVVAFLRFLPLIVATGGTRIVSILIVRRDDEFLVKIVQFRGGIGIGVGIRVGVRIGTAITIGTIILLRRECESAPGDQRRRRARGRRQRQRRRGSRESFYMFQFIYVV